MELVLLIRQMMAELKFLEVQKILEVKLLEKNAESRPELIAIFLQCLEAQNKSLPAEFVLERLESLVDEDVDRAFQEISRLPHDQRFFKRTEFIKAKIYSKLGFILELKKTLIGYYLFLIENRIPSRSSFIDSLADKYFKNDFQINLQLLTLSLMTHDLERSEKIIHGLMFNSLERVSQKGIKEKMGALEIILSPYAESGPLSLYRNLIVLMGQGIRAKSDYKRLVESIIYFSSFKVQTLILGFLDRENLKDAAQEYAQVIKGHPDYDFVYFDKFFPQLKSYFFVKKKIVEVPEPKIEIDLKLFEPKFNSSIESDFEDQEDHDLDYALKFQDYSIDQLLDLTVSFIQCDLLSTALKAVNLVFKKELSSEDFLKACYLKLTCLLRLKDYRGALDVSLIALDKASRQNDLLSFLYTQAEALIHLEKKKDAVRVLKKILTLDPHYRLTQERLARLDEI